MRVKLMWCLALLMHVATLTVAEQGIHDRIIDSGEVSGLKVSWESPMQLPSPQSQSPLGSDGRLNVSVCNRDPASWLNGTLLLLASGQSYQFPELVNETGPIADLGNTINHASFKGGVYGWKETLNIPPGQCIASQLPLKIWGATSEETASGGFNCNPVNLMVWWLTGRDMERPQLRKIKAFKTGDSCAIAPAGDEVTIGAKLSSSLDARESTAINWNLNETLNDHLPPSLLAKLVRDDGEDADPSTNAFAAQNGGLLVLAYIKCRRRGDDMNMHHMGVSTPSPQMTTQQVRRKKRNVYATVVDEDSMGDDEGQNGDGMDGGDQIPVGFTWLSSVGPSSAEINPTSWRTFSVDPIHSKFANARRMCGGERDTECKLCFKLDPFGSLSNTNNNRNHSDDTVCTNNVTFNCGRFSFDGFSSTVLSGPLFKQYRGDEPPRVVEYDAKMRKFAIKCDEEEDGKDEMLKQEIVKSITEAIYRDDVNSDRLKCENLLKGSTDGGAVPEISRDCRDAMTAVDHEALQGSEDREVIHQHIRPVIEACGNDGRLRDIIAKVNRTLERLRMAEGDMYGRTDMPGTDMPDRDRDEGEEENPCIEVEDRDAAIADLSDLLRQSSSANSAHSGNFTTIFSREEREEVCSYAFVQHFLSQPQAALLSSQAHDEEEKEEHRIKEAVKNALISHGDDEGSGDYNMNGMDRQGLESLVHDGDAGVSDEHIERLRVFGGDGAGLSDDEERRLLEVALMCSGEIDEEKGSQPRSTYTYADGGIHRTVFDPVRGVYKRMRIAVIRCQECEDTMRSYGMSAEDVCDTGDHYGNAGDYGSTSGGYNDGSYPRPTGEADIMECPGPNEVRENCQGFNGGDEDDCENLMCCWDDQNGDPRCFMPISDIECPNDVVPDDRRVVCEDFTQGMVEDDCNCCWDAAGSPSCFTPMRDGDGGDGPTGDGDGAPTGNPPR